MVRQFDPTTKEAGFSALVAICIMLVGLSIAELLMRLTMLGVFGHLQAFGIKYVGWSLLPICAFAVRYTKPLGWRSAPIALAGLALLYLAITSFRGLWVWYGTFDAYWLPRTGWEAPALMGCALGFGLFPVDMRLRAPNVKLACIWLVALLGSAVIEWWGAIAFTDAIDSVYAPTRFVIIAAVFMILAVGMAIDWRSA